MRSRIILGLAVVLSLLMLKATPVCAKQPTWQAGFAKANITPEPGLWMAGYASRDHAAVGTMQDLWVKALALSDAQGHRAVLVTADLLGLPKAMYDGICGKLERQCGLARADIMLNSSHTHSGPVLRHALYDIYPLDDAQRARIDAYSAKLEDTFVETVAAAFKHLQPVAISVGASSAKIGANRRAGRLGAAAQAGADRSVLAPTDPTVPVVNVSSPDGGFRVIVFGYACHCTTLDIDQWNGDYAGFAQVNMEQRFPGANAMFVAGCGADQNPDPRRSVEDCRTHGKTLADAVCRALEQPMTPVAPTLATAIALVDMPFGEKPSVEYLKKTTEKKNYEARWAARLLDQIKSGTPLADSYPTYPVQVWQFGSYRLIALGGEVVVDYVLRLRKLLGPDTWVAGYTNDVMAYIPSHRVWQEGGYEAGAFSVYGLPATRWTEKIEDRIVATAVELAQRLKASQKVSAN